MQIREILTLKSDTIYSIAPTDPVQSAVGKMVELGVGSLVVMKNDEMVGLLTERDVVQGMVSQGCAHGVGAGEVDRFGAPEEVQQQAAHVDKPHTRRQQATHQR